MNKLLETGQKVRERILSLADSEGKLDYGVLDMIEETVREVCAEYARSVVPTPEEVTKEFFVGNKTLTQVYLDRIDQDYKEIIT